MDLNSPESWRWVWFVLVVVFLAGELFTPGVFFLLPFAAGALAAGIGASFGLPVLGEWLLFIAVSALAFAALWPLGRKLEQVDTAQEGVGATRWVGQQATVVDAIPARGVGTVRLEREVWRAESPGTDAIEPGTEVMVTEIAGTRLVVAPIDRSVESTDRLHTINGPTDGRLEQGD